jgi:4-amino-4-deoxy-L-arabinose transferase-like glycosyltransferase
MISKFRTWTTTNKFEFSLLLGILALGGFLRFYKITSMNFFTYDQARDALFIKRIIVDHKFRLIGTQSSAPGVYTGPAYYYLMAPALGIARLNPTGIDIAIALFGTASVFLIYLVGKLYFGAVAGLVTSLLYATSPVVVHQSRFAWNPNLLPFFIILILGALYQVFIEGKENYWLLLMSSLAFSLQLHYSAVCFIPGLLLTTIWLRRRLGNFKIIGVSLVLFLLLMLPLLIFDLRHGFINTKNTFSFLFRGKGQEVGLSLWLVLKRAGQASLELFQRLIINVKGGMYLFFLAFVLVALCTRQIRKENTHLGLGVLLFLLLTSLFLAAFYPKPIFFFYYTFVYPIPFLLVGYLADWAWSGGKIFKALVLTLVLIIVFLSLKRTSFVPSSWRTQKDIMLVAETIANDLDPSWLFNLAGICRDRDRWDHNAVDYRYFLESFYNKRALDWEYYQKAEKLYLISELTLERPLAVRIMEVSDFGPKVVEKKWVLKNGAEIYRLGK